MKWLDECVVEMARANEFAFPLAPDHPVLQHFSAGSTAAAPDLVAAGEPGEAPDVSAELAIDDDAPMVMSPEQIEAMNAVRRSTQAEEEERKKKKM